MHIHFLLTVWDEEGHDMNGMNNARYHIYKNTPELKKLPPTDAQNASHHVVIGSRSEGATCRDKTSLNLDGRLLAAFRQWLQQICLMSSAAVAVH